MASSAPSSSAINSLEWRAKKLEEKIIGGREGLLNYDTDGQEPPVCDQLNQVNAIYKNFINTNGESYSRFKEQYEKHRKLLNEVDSSSAQVGDKAKVELVLAHGSDLVKHLESVKHMAELADKVLDESKWPDMTKFRERLDKLETITRDQHLQSVNLDQRTEELIEIYNDIITTFKGNTVIWNQKLDAYENEERKMDPDE